MSEIATNLFVYGTLMPGESNYRHIEDLVIDHKLGTIDGALIDLGAFPALVPGEGIVRGVVLQIVSAALQITDRIEGCVPDRGHCLYLRKEVNVSPVVGESVTAWTYMFADLDRIEDHPRLIVDNIDDRAVSAWTRG